MIGSVSSFDDYLTYLASTTALPGDASENDWLALETSIAQIFLRILEPFVSNAYYKPSPHWGDISFSLDEVSDADIRLAALNFRGLYQRNGRETHLVPCGNFYPKAPDNEDKRHGILHNVYMYLVDKANSINQLFLANTTLDGLLIEFESEDGGQSKIIKHDTHLSVKISREFASDLAPSDIREKWTEAFSFILTASWDELRSLPEEIKRRRFPLFFAKLHDYSRLHAREKLNALVFKDLSLFDSWHKFWASPDSSRSPAEILLQYEEWLRSLCWLQFYCRDDHAGRYFYTVRLPPLTDKTGILPDSSLSIVSGQVLPDSSQQLFLRLRTALVSNTGFNTLLDTARVRLDEFMKNRLGYESQPDDQVRLAKIFEDLSGVLPLDFDRAVFLMKMARKLVGQRHEGQELHFCFIFGFSRERIDAESMGLLEEIASDLGTQWEDFESTCAVDSHPERIAEAMALWIKTNDLQLQPWDTGLFFEEMPAKRYVIPISLVRVLSTLPQHPTTIGTEFQLRHAVKRITKRSKSTLCLLVGRKGIIMFLDGKTFILSCRADDGWETSVSPEGLGLKSIEDKISTFLMQQLRMVFSESVDDAKIKTACSLIDKLSEVLVCMGHGALILVGTRGEGDDTIPPLPPLNPVWRLRTAVSDDAVENDCITYALMAALDGATELILPRKDSGEDILFGCRKAVQPRTQIWTEDQQGRYALAEGIAIHPLKLIGKGTRHHSALALSKDLEDRAIVITVSADGPITLWHNGDKLDPPSDVKLRYSP